MLNDCNANVQKGNEPNNSSIKMKLVIVKPPLKVAKGLSQGTVFRWKILKLKNVKWAQDYIHASFIHSSIHSFFHSSIHSFIHSFIYSFTCLLYFYIYFRYNSQYMPHLSQDTSTTKNRNKRWKPYWGFDGVNVCWRGTVRYRDDVDGMLFK